MGGGASRPDADHASDVAQRPPLVRAQTSPVQQKQQQDKQRRRRSAPRFRAVSLFIKKKAVVKEDSWKVKERGSLKFDKTDHVEYHHLRQILETCSTQFKFGQYVKRVQTQSKKRDGSQFYFNRLLLWCEIESYSIIDTPISKYEVATAIYRRYLSPRSSFPTGISQMLCDKVKETLDQWNLHERSSMEEWINFNSASKNGDSTSSPSRDEDKLFQKISNWCFRELSGELYCGYKDMVQQQKEGLASNSKRRGSRLGYRQSSDKGAAETRTFISINDFDFISVLGKGGYATVFRVKKKSTKREYAMKVISKPQLVHSYIQAYGEEAAKSLVSTEMDVLIAMRSLPGLVRLQYAFQTPQHVTLCLDIMDGGDLEYYAGKQLNGIVNIKLIQFWSAQILVALHGVHQLGLIFRDLKPSNILLDYLGNAYLSDVGLVSQSTSTLSFIRMDQHNQTLRAYATSTLKAEMMSELLSESSSTNVQTDSVVPALGSLDSVRESCQSVSPSNVSPRPIDQIKGFLHGQDNSTDSPRDSPNFLKDRCETMKNKFELRKLSSLQVQRKEIVGTEGYRAPEMFYTNSEEGYGFSVDWWAFGILCFKLQRGMLPFTQDICAPSLEESQAQFDALDPLSKGVPEKRGFDLMQPHLNSLISGFLSVDVNKRLGCRGVPKDVGRPGLWQAEMSEICSHPFYDGVNWKKLYFDNNFSGPSVVKAPNEYSRPIIETMPAKFQNFNDCVNEIGDELMEGVPNFDQDTLDSFFTSWHYQNPCTKVAEVSAGELCSAQDQVSKERESELVSHSHEADRLRSAIYSSQFPQRKLPSCGVVDSLLPGSFRKGSLNKMSSFGSLQENDELIE